MHPAYVVLVQMTRMINVNVNVKNSNKESGKEKPVQIPSTLIVRHHGGQKSRLRCRTPHTAQNATIEL